MNTQANCPTCGTQGMALEYTATPKEPAVFSTEPLYAGGFVVRSGIIESVKDGSAWKYPALVFDFTLAGNEPIQPIVLVLEDADMADASRIIGNAAIGAVENARMENGLDPKTGRRRKR